MTDGSPDRMRAESWQKYYWSERPKVFRVVTVMAILRREPVELLVNIDGV